MLVAPEIFVYVTSSGEDCHWMIPVNPLKVIFDGELPRQMVWSAEGVPPTLVALTVTRIGVEVADGQTPLVTTAR